MLYVWYDKEAKCVCTSEMRPEYECQLYENYTFKDSERFFDDNGAIGEKTEAQIAEEKKAILATQMRGKRNQLLAESDWTQLPDAMVDKAAWAVYRQSLRDVPQQPGFPDTVVWPEEPK